MNLNKALVLILMGLVFGSGLFLCSVSVLTVIVASMNFMEAGYDIISPECAIECMNSVKKQYHMSVMREVCSNQSSQRSLFNCFSHHCDSEEYGSALDAGVSTCLALGTEIVPLRPVLKTDPSLSTEQPSPRAQGHSTFDEAVVDDTELFIRQFFPIAPNYVDGLDGVFPYSQRPTEASPSRKASLKVKNSPDWSKLTSHHGGITDIEMLDSSAAETAAMTAPKTPPPVFPSSAQVTDSIYERRTPHTTAMASVMLTVHLTPSKTTTAIADILHGTSTCPSSTTSRLKPSLVMAEMTHVEIPRTCERTTQILLDSPKSTMPPVMTLDVHKIGDEAVAQGPLVRASVAPKCDESENPDTKILSKISRAVSNKIYGVREGNLVMNPFVIWSNSVEQTATPTQDLSTPTTKKSTATLPYPKMLGIICVWMFATQALVHFGLL